SSLRILELLPGRKDDELAFRLVVADWNNRPIYEAISYAWGSPAERVWTPHNGRYILVPQNLLDGLCQMCFPDQSRLIWADSICIDQNSEKEKAVQISNMRRIYTRATRVLVWLG
ncbi:HET-domain-containing protein, partial [Mytilinidion resinicola]